MAEQDYVALAANLIEQGLGVLDDSGDLRRAEALIAAGHAYAAVAHAAAVVAAIPAPRAGGPAALRVAATNGFA